jgi:hypothetical protein
MIRCLHCGAETSNGLALCETCRVALVVRLEWVPVHFANLSRLYTPGRPNGSLGGRIDDGRGIYDEHGNEIRYVREGGGLAQVQNALSLAHADLIGWARALGDDRPQLIPAIDGIGSLGEREFVAAFCNLLSVHVASLTTLPWCGDLLASLTRMERRLGRLTDQWVPGWYAGHCQRCQTRCYVEPGVTWVTCPGCGVTTPASDHIDIVLDEARDWIARPKGTPKHPGLAEAIVALTGASSIERVANLIRQWHKRGLLVACVYVDRDGDPAEKRFRLGDVMDRLRTSDRAA